METALGTEYFEVLAHRLKVGTNATAISIQLAGGHTSPNLLQKNVGSHEPDDAAHELRLTPPTNPMLSLLIPCVCSRSSTTYRSQHTTSLASAMGDSRASASSEKVTVATRITRTPRMSLYDPKTLLRSRRTADIHEIVHSLHAAPSPATAAHDPSAILNWRIAEVTATVDAALS